VAIIVSLALLAGVAASYLALSRNPKPRVSLSAPVQPFFDGGGRLSPGAFAAAYSPDGSRLAVRSADGIGLADRGAVKAVTPRGSNVVDFAWLPGGDRLLVAEGPIPTGQLDALALNGRSAGTVKLLPSFSVGSGYGLAVDSTARHAVASRARADQLSGVVHLDLVEVDLQSGVVRELTPDPDAQSSRPFYIDDTHVLYQREQGNHTAAAVLDLVTLARRDLTGPNIEARPVGVLLGGGYAAYATHSGDLFAVAPDGGQPIRLGSRLGPVAAVDPTGTYAVVVTASTQDAGLDQLVEKRLTPPPKRGQ
jgi:hypothetical protein